MISIGDGILCVSKFPQSPDLVISRNSPEEAKGGPKVPRQHVSHPRTHICYVLLALANEYTIHSLPPRAIRPEILKIFLGQAARAPLPYLPPPNKERFFFILPFSHFTNFIHNIDYIEYYELNEFNYNN